VAEHRLHLFKQVIMDMTMELNHAHEKVNSLLYQNPELVADMADLEDIIGPFGTPTPDAPANS
jgi:hypothetical protein